MPPAPAMFVAPPHLDAPLTPSLGPTGLETGHATAGATATVETDLRGLGAEWTALRARTKTASFYQSHAWCSIWVEACEAARVPEAVRVVTVREAGRLVVVWPLAIRRMGSIAVLHALGEPATQYCEALVDPDLRAGQWMALAWQAVVAMRDVDVVNLRHVRSDGPLATFGRPWLARCAVVPAAAPYLLLGARVDPDRRRSGRSLQALRRHLKRLATHGPVTFEPLPREAHLDALSSVFRMKKAWLKANGLASAGYGHPANESAIRALAARGLMSGWTLRVGEEPAAIEIGVNDAGYYYSLIQSYDARYALHSPGRILFWKIFDDSRSGVTVFDFLPKADPHKTEWTNDAVPVCDYTVARTLKGFVGLLFITHVRRALKRGFLMLPVRHRATLLRVMGRAHRA